MAISLYPLNDLVVKVTLKAVDPTTGRIVPVSGDTVIGFIATSNSPTAIAADPSLSVTANSIGGGVYLVAFDASILTPTLLATLFTTVTPYLIVQDTNNIRVYSQMVYTASRAAVTS